MIYILFGEQELMIKNRIKKILRDDFFTNSEIIKLNMPEIRIGALIDEYDQFSITGEPKVIIANNAYFIESSTHIKNKLFDKKELDELYRCISSDVNSNSIIFVINGSKIDLKSNIVKFAKTNGKIYEFKNVTKNDWPLYVKEYFNKRNVKISDDAVDELVKRVHGDLTTFSNEATKLMLFKGSSITKDDVISLVSNVLEDDVFSILNNLIINNKDAAIKIYRDLRVQGVEPVTLTSLITTSIIYMLNVKNLSNLGLKADEIAAKTGSSTGRVFMSFKNLKLISEEKLYNVLDNLYDIDYKIKHNLVDRFVIFETFLANF